MSGVQFVEALERLEYPGVQKLDGHSFDWLFEEEHISLLLDWFCENIQVANVVYPKELNDFEQLRISSGGILDGAQLDEALHNLSLVSEEDLPEDRLQEEIRQLKEEFALCKRRKDTFIQHRNKLSLHQTQLSNRLVGMDKIGTLAKHKYAKCLEQSQADNLKMNESLADMTTSVKRLTGLYLAGGGPVSKEMQEAVFLSQVQLESYYIAEEKFTQELNAFTKKQFFEGIADMAGATQGSQYELLEVSNPVSLLVSGEREGVNMDDCKELARLKILYPKSESNRINALVESKCTASVCQYAEDRIKSLKIKPYPQNIKELSAKLQDAQSSLSVMTRDLALLGETKLPAYIRDSASLQVTKVLRGEYTLKLTRQDYFTSNQDQVIDQLVVQRARNEYLTMAYEMELKAHHDTHRLLTATIMLLRANLATKLDRIKMMEEVSHHPSKYQRGTVDSRDKFITHLYQLLSSSGPSTKQQIFLTYQDLEGNTNKLHHQLSSLRASLASTNSIQDDRLSVLESNMKACQSLVYAESSTVGGLPVLSPKPIVDLLNQLDNMLKKLEEAVMDIIKDVDGKKKKLKTDPVQVMERELFPQFFIKPDELRRSMEEITARVQALLVK